MLSVQSRRSALRCTCRPLGAGLSAPRVLPAVGVVFVLHVGIAVDILARQDRIVVQARDLQTAYRPHPAESRRRRARTTSGSRRTSRPSPRDCASSSLAAADKRSGNSTGWSCRRIATPIRRRVTPSCWAADSGLAVAPDVPVAMLRSARRARIDEPLVLVGGMVQHEVEDDANAICFRASAAGQSLTACHTSDRCLRSRTRRTQSPPAATESTA